MKDRPNEFHPGYRRVRITFVAELTYDVPRYEPEEMETRMPWFENYVNNGKERIMVKKVLDRVVIDEDE